MNPRDLRLLDGKLGTSDGGADLDCIGGVTAADVAIARAHLHHRAPRTQGKPGALSITEE